MRPSDFEAMYRLDQLCFEPGIAYSREELARFLDIATARSVVAEAAGAIAGFAVGYLAGRRVAHVVTLDVRPERRRRGLARELLGGLLERLEGAGARQARLEVSVQNAAAVAFYEAMGFSRRRELRHYYGPGLHAWEMGKRLAQRVARRRSTPRVLPDSRSSSNFSEGTGGLKR
jgi:[ribosomal protein S18]-alanine N-acetyltransferase